MNNFKDTEDIYLYDGTIITGKTDNNGYVDIKTLKQGQYFILMER